jgi:hypothetical protein
VLELGDAYRRNPFSGSMYLSPVASARLWAGLLTQQPREKDEFQGTIACRRL